MATKAKTKTAGVFQYDSSAPANPTLLNYPADPYGLCSELRKCMTKTVGRLCGDSKKLTILERNLALLIGHMYNRFAEQGGTRAVVKEPAAQEAAPGETPDATYTAPAAQPAESAEPASTEPVTVEKE